MKAWHLLLPAAVLLASCIKDDLDVDALNTNPLDRDYAGTPLVVLHEESTALNQLGGGTDTVYLQTVRVRKELLPALITWDWHVKDLSTGEVSVYENGNEYLTMARHQASLGATYCYEYTLVVQYVPTKPYVYCGVAEL